MLMRGAVRPAAWRALTALTALTGLTAMAGVHAGTLPGAACDAPLHSPQARRYELQGTTVLSMSVLAAGKPADVEVARSSGWKMLDADTVKLAATCPNSRVRDGAGIDSQKRR